MEVNKSNNLEENIYQELKVIANKLMQHERANHTLSPTDLVHEAYLKLSKSDVGNYKEKQYIFVLARQMRRLLVDYGRSKSAVKNGSRLNKVMYTDALGINDGNSIDFDLISQAIDELEEVNKRCAQIVELYYFTGVSRELASKLFDISLSTFARDIHFAKAFIGDYMEGNS
jgi:RNA polymerase sigma factor (TIGR02999 family)